MEKVKEKTSFFRKFVGDKKFYLMVLSIAVPIMIQNGITNFVSLLDKAKFYGMTLLSFHAGAALSLILYMAYDLSGVWLCLIPAFYAVWLIAEDRHTVTAATTDFQNTTVSNGYKKFSYKKKEA